VRGRIAEEVVERFGAVPKAQKAVRNARAAQVAFDERRMAVVVFDEHDADGLSLCHGWLRKA
jgi:hypothetical protein